MLPLCQILNTPLSVFPWRKQWIINGRRLSSLVRRCSVTASTNLCFELAFNPTSKPIRASTSCSAVSPRPLPNKYFLSFLFDLTFYSVEYRCSLKATEVEDISWIFTDISLSYFLKLLRAKAGTVLVIAILSVCLSVCHTGGSVKNGAS